jgi:purine-binding chemotaxis protein CheW
MLEKEQMQPEIIETKRINRMADKYLTFCLDGRNYGIEISYLMEIVALTDITEVPDMKDYVKGVVDIRGRVVPVFDTRLRLGLPELEYMERTCVMILSVNNNSVGLIVDSVREVVKIPKEDIDQVHTDIEKHDDQCIKAMSRVKDDAVILLDVEKII